MATIVDHRLSRQAYEDACRQLGTHCYTDTEIVSGVMQRDDAPSVRLAMARLAALEPDLEDSTR